MSSPGAALVLGGYGGFGARLARRLAGDGWRVLIAGRNLAKAEACAATMPMAQGLIADRNGDLTAVLARHRPDLVVDAAGPFQGSDYRVALACIAAGAHYLDLADARDFVCGIGQLDRAAQAAGVAIISGASSVPALSGAVLRELAHGMERVDSIELAISASDRATAGASVATAILGYAGREIAVWDDHHWRTGTGWQELHRQHYTVGTGTPLKRIVALVDVPDHALWPARFPGRPATRFRAGPEFSHQVVGIWALSWLVKWGLLGSLAKLAPLLRPLQRLTGWMCGDRSAMAASVQGLAAGQLVGRNWTLVAEDGDGPEVPTLAAQLLARRIAQGDLACGARDAGAELALADFAPLFEELAIRTEVVG